MELCLRLRLHLQEFITKIEVFAVGFKQQYDVDMEPADSDGKIVGKKRAPRMTDDFVECMEGLAYDYFPKLLKDDDFHSFVKHVAERRMSREGRFLRVHFKTGRVADLVPDGRLATGVELVKDSRRKSGWQFVSPDLDLLWREYDARN